MTFPKGGSEYGGYPGLVQPEPHDVRDEAHEQMMAVYMTDSADETSTPEKVIDGIRRQGRVDRGKQNG
jgi:hypothetical protein